MKRLAPWLALSVAVIGICGGIALLFYGRITGHAIGWPMIALMVAGAVAYFVGYGKALANDDLWKDE